MRRIIYQPLTLTEIVLLLQQSREAIPLGNRRELFLCYSRLEDGIVGLTCPYPVDGPIADAIGHLDDLLYVWIVSDAPGDSLEQFAQLLLQTMRSPLLAEGSEPRC